MVLPVLMLEGAKLDGATPVLLGLAMGAYGLTQAMLQIPAGALSDRFGRKPVILIGLVVFALGSLVAALATSIEWLIVGRALQGGGAIASAIMALVTDLTNEDKRMRAMAFIGASIGMSFSVALVLGPWLATLGGLPLIFGLTGALAVAGMLVTLLLVPSPPKVRHRDASAVTSEVFKQLQNRSMWPLTSGVFLLHALMVALFVAVPMELKDSGLPAAQHSLLYLPVLIVAFVLMVPFVIVAEKRQKMKAIVLFACVLIGIALALMTQFQSLWAWAVLLLIYFLGFNLMEATLPSWLSKIAPAGSKGSAMGIYSSMQFFGAFVGGVLGGWVQANYGANALFLVMAVAVALWALVMASIEAPRHLKSVRLAIHNTLEPSQQQALLSLPGVHELIELPEENAAYLKVNASEFSQSDALAIIQPEGEDHGSQR